MYVGGESSMKEIIKQTIVNFIDDYCETNNIENIWRNPVIGFGDANSDYIKKLPKLILDSHRLPSDYLTDAKIIISYFLPFKKEIGQSNEEGDSPSFLWGKAYVVTDTLASKLNKHLINIIEKMGYNAADPQEAAKFNPVILKSQWSQRHIAYQAGLGTFGINNMLISEQGSCGRYFSIITNLDINPNEPLKEERCKYKVDNSCGICIKKCRIGALKYNNFDRIKCSENCTKNTEIIGIGVCGKCTVGLPCSYKNPMK